MNGRGDQRADALLDILFPAALRPFLLRPIASFGAVITGKPQGTGGWFSSESCPWNDLLIAEGDCRNWTINIKPKKMGDDWRRVISEFRNVKLLI